MDGLKAWGRGFARLAIACAVTLLVLAPSVDAVFCPEGGMALASSSAETPQVIKTAESGDHGKAASGDLVGVCIYGHCHHGAPVLPPITADSAPLDAAPTERHALLNTPVPVKHPHFEQNRPPRA
ncbi:hypothetical protein [Phenylobacterium sp.]|uniref:hypothetical protein n=1 Tax=Phenylobacterium sp. TaxID=1871053 RepID=UPI00273079BE|nr:hypothetical protein [Phenylobacterium sp.]MDP1616580.1 hypothetical protein [Phenylobacterium sp.]